MARPSQRVRDIFCAPSQAGVPAVPAQTDVERHPLAALPPISASLSGRVSTAACGAGVQPGGRPAAASWPSARRPAASQSQHPPSGRGMLLPAPSAPPQKQPQHTEQEQQPHAWAATQQHPAAPSRAQPAVAAASCTQQHLGAGWLPAAPPWYRASQTSAAVGPFQKLAAAPVAEQQHLGRQPQQPVHAAWRRVEPLVQHPPGCGLQHPPQQHPPQQRPAPSLAPSTSAVEGAVGTLAAGRSNPSPPFQQQQQQQQREAQGRDPGFPASTHDPQSMLGCQLKPPVHPVQQQLQAVWGPSKQAAAQHTCDMDWEAPQLPQQLQQQQQQRQLEQQQQQQQLEQWQQRKQPQHGPEQQDQPQQQRQQQQAPPPLPPEHSNDQSPSGPPAAAAAAVAVERCVRLKRGLRLKLSDWGLPPGVVQAFECKGVRSMYPWQAAALECGEAYNNLVYCAPTSGGKSLVAEVLMLRRLLASTRDIPQPRRSKPKYGRVLVVLPYVSIVSEKTEHLSDVMRPMHATVRGFFGGSGGEEGQPLAPRGETVAICTIEKANVAINKLAQEGRLGELCCVVVDELHMVSDTDRGIGLEMSLSKLMFSPQAQHVQVIGMSATMGGLDSLRAWLRAELFLTNFRPVPLAEHAMFRGKVYEKISPQELKQLEEGHPPLRGVRDVAPCDPKRDADRLVPLVAESAAEGHSVLVFCSSRKQCESAAALIADLLPKIAPPPPDKRAELAEQRGGIVADIKIAMGGAMCLELEQCMLQGIAWHHAGLTSEERAGVERAYRCGAVSVITATSTLAAGVNLPARRVILRSLHQGIGPVSRSQYLQMVGRAGRAGHSAVGESFLIGKGAPKGQEWQQVCALLTAPVPSLQSRVLSPDAAATIASLGAPALKDSDTHHLQQLLLEGIANGTVREGGDVARLLCSTFAAHQQGLKIMGQASKAAFRALMGGKALVQYSPGQEGQLELTHKGQAVYDSALPLDAAMQLYESCTAADNGFMLDKPLVLLYHCLLSHPFLIISWAEWGRLLQTLDCHELRIAETVGVLPMHVHAALSGRTPGPEVHARHARLAAALALSELTQEKDVQGVVAKWGREGFVSRGLSRGQIQKLQQDAGKWMGMASLLCESAGWWPLATLYSNLSQMAAAGVRQELLPLMRIPDMDAAKARALYKAGVRDAQTLATADTQAVARALAPAIAQQMRSRSSGTRQQQQKRGSGGGPASASAAASAANYAAVGMAARAADTLVFSARTHLKQQMQEIQLLAADIEEDEAADAASRATTQQQQQQQAVGGSLVPTGLPPHLPPQRAGALGPEGVEEGDELSPDELALIQQHVAGVGGLAGSQNQLQAVEVNIAPAAKLQWSHGIVRLTELRPRTPVAQLEEFFASWAAAPLFSLALHVLSDEELATAALAVCGGSKRQPGGAGSGAGAQRLQGMAVCWDSKKTFYLELSAVHCARQLPEGGGTVLSAARRVLAQPSGTLVCHGAVAALAELMHLGVTLGGCLEDSQVAAALLWPDAAADEPARLELRRLQPAVAPSLKARVPNVCRGGVTSTCRTGVLALACMEPLKGMLAHRRMLEAFVNLECPTALALLHINSSRAAPRLHAPTLHAVLRAAQSSAEGSQEQLRRLYAMPQLQLSSNDTLMQLLGVLRMAQPERGRGPPLVSLSHLQLLLQRCRPHQHRERQALACMVQHKATGHHVSEPLRLLLETATAVEASAAHPPAAAGTAQQVAGDGAGAQAAPAAAAVPAAVPCEASAGAESCVAARLRLQVSSLTWRLSYGSEADKYLASLVAAAWTPLTAAGASLSVQAELEQGSLTAEAAAAAAAASNGGGGGLPVALCVPRRQLAALAACGTSLAAAAATDLGADAPPEDEEDEEQQVWVAGLLTAIVGKRLRTALNFGAAQQLEQQRRRIDGSSCYDNSGGCSTGSGSQRASIARLRVPLLPDETARLQCAMAGGTGWAPTPSTVELQWPCDQLWRLCGPSAALLAGTCGAGGIACGGGSGGGGSSARQEQQGGTAGEAAAQAGQAAAVSGVAELGAAGPPVPGPLVSWGLQGYLSAAGVFAAAPCAVPNNPAVLGERPHKALAAAAAAQQPAPLFNLSGGAATGAAGCCNNGGSGLLVRLELRCVELAVLAHMSGQSELLAACRSSGGGGAYRQVGNCWAAAAGQLEVPGSRGAGSGGAAGVGQPPLLISGGTAEAVVQCLVKGWSSRKLGHLLCCARQAAAAAVDSFLAAFPQLQAWLGHATAAAEAACCAVTLAGRQRQCAPLKRADDAMGRGRLHKALLQHMLEGSVADVLKAALLGTHAALAGMRPGVTSGGERGDVAQKGPEVVMVLGHSLVLHLPAAVVAAHGGSAGAGAAVAAAVRPALRSLYVGRVSLKAPLGVQLSIGRSLHLFDQQQV